MTFLYSLLKNKYLPFLFAVPLFFCVCHYQGIRLDAVLYITQYVYSIDPSRFIGDPSFEFGNQDSLGFFSPIFGVFIEYFGVVNGSFIYTVLMQFAWIVAVVFLIKSILQLTRNRFWILPTTLLFIYLFSVGNAYFEIRFFKYMPSYACSRSLSIVLGMGAIAFLFYQKRAISLFFIILGTIVHPITAGWCLPFWLFYFFPRTRFFILVLSLVFPFSFFLHFGVFDTIANDWLPRPLEFRPTYETISRYILLLTYFGLLIKYYKNSQVRKISQSLCLLVTIVFYWDAWAGFGEHVFLYQVQPWRAVWLPSIISVPLSVCVVKDAIRKISKKRPLTTHDFGIFLLIASFLTPKTIVLVPFASVILFLRTEHRLSLKWYFFAFLCLIFSGYVLQQYFTWCMQGFSPFLGFDYLAICHSRDSFLVYQFLFSVGFVLFFLKKKRLVLAIFFGSFIFFSQFMLLPILPIFLFSFPKERKITYWGGTFVLIVFILFDGLFDVETRRQTLMDAMPLSFYWTLVAMIMSGLSIYLFKFISYFGIVLWLSICSVFAFENYEADYLGRHAKESQLDAYLHKSIFPQVKQRGRMLIDVRGDYIDNPMLRFMTGTYLTNSSMVGSIFNKEHYRNVLERSHLLYWKELKPESSAYFEYEKIIAKISNKDTLVDRVNFLCGKGEIMHLVTDETTLPFAKEDSTMVSESQKIFLYVCPSINKDEI